MITHVASAGENGGRVIVQLRTSAPNPAALDAAFRIARAYNAELEGLLVEPCNLEAIASYPFTREISPDGRSSQALGERVAQDSELAAGALRKLLRKRCRDLNVPCRFSMVRGPVVPALVRACQNAGPWNIIAMTETPFSAGQSWQAWLAKLDQLFMSQVSATGVLISPAYTYKGSGSMTIVVEDPERVAGMLRTAERLCRNDQEIVLLLVAMDEESLATMEAQLRLAHGSELAGIKLAVAEITRGEPRVVAEAIRRMNSGFVIGQYGGQLLNATMNLREVLNAARCPLLLVP